MTGGALEVGGLVAADHAELHESTAPAAIAAAQRAAVREAQARLRTTDAVAVSAEACLPVSVVVRRQAEIRGGWR